MLLVGGAGAQEFGSIEGHVTSPSNGEPIANVDILLVQSRRRSITNDEGYYLVDSIPAGTDTIRVLRLGFKVVMYPVKIVPGETQQVDVTLEPNKPSGIEEVTTSMGPRNPWSAIGAQIGYNLSGGEAADNILASGRALLEVLGRDSPHYGIYLFGNLSRLKPDVATDDPDKVDDIKLRELQQADQGIFVDIVPHLFWGDPGNRSESLWLSAGWKVNALRDSTDNVRYLNQARVSIGGEITGLPGKFAGLPASLDVEASLGIQMNKDVFHSVFPDRGTALKNIDVSLIIPAGSGRGLILSSTMTQRAKPVWMLGLLFANTKNTAPIANP